MSRVAARVTMGAGRTDGTPRPYRPEGHPMNGSRIPGLVLPVLFLVAVAAGAFWYWRHRDDE